MANRREVHHARRAAVAALGKGLSRRARSRCELCGEGGPLAVVELDGAPEEPEEDWALLLCARCQALDEAPPETLRFLTTAMWSEVAPAQVQAVRALRGLAEDWAKEALDGLWLDEAISARLGD
jgi:protein PhnA